VMKQQQNQPTTSVESVGEKNNQTNKQTGQTSEHRGKAERRVAKRGAACCAVL
jgi:hypothetical protein